MEYRDSGLCQQWFGYVSKKQTGVFRTVTQIRQARTSSNCGDMEMCLDPKELQKNIG